MFSQARILASFVFATLLHLSLTQLEADEAKPERYALLVAVTTYQHAEMNQPGLQYPEVDAQAVGEFLKNSGYEVEYLLGQKATKAAIESRLDSLANKLDAEGVLVLGFWGHGIEFEGTGESMFFPYDSRIRTVVDSQNRKQYEDNGQPRIEPDPASLVGMSQGLHALKSSGAGHKVLLADCCRDSPHQARGRAFGTRTTLNDLPDNTAAIFACSEKEKAFESGEWGHGAFTKCLLDLLPTLTNGDGDDVNAITGRLKRNVTKLVEGQLKAGETQTVNPIINGAPELRLLTKEPLEYRVVIIGDNRYVEYVVSIPLVESQTRTIIVEGKAVEQVGSITRRVAEQRRKQVPRGMKIEDFLAEHFPGRKYRELKSDIGKVVPVPEVFYNVPDLKLSNTAGEWFASTLAACQIGDSPQGWICPANTFSVAEYQDSRRLSYAGNQLAFVNLPSAIMPALATDFVLEFDITLADNELEIVFQHKAATRRLRIFEDRGWHIAGASPPQGTVLFSREKPSTVRLERRSNQIKLFLLDLNDDKKPVFIRQFAWSTGVTSLRLGLATGYSQRPASITGLRLASRADSVDSGDAKDFLEETFLWVRDGEVPDSWTATPALAVAASTSATQPFLSKFTANDASVMLPSEWSEAIQGNYLLEADFAVFGGGSHDPSSKLELVFNAGKQTARIPCYTFRGKLLAGNASSPDGANFPEYLSPRSYATIRIVRNEDRFQIGMVPLNGDDMVVFSQVPSNPVKINKLSLGFSGGNDSNSSARVYAIRVQSLEQVSE